VSQEIARLLRQGQGRIWLLTVCNGVPVSQHERNTLVRAIDGVWGNIRKKKKY
jgi:hypothetical protein